MPNPLTDPRFVTIFVTDEQAFGGSGNDIYPVRPLRRLLHHRCRRPQLPGDVPSNPGNKNMWGHFVSYAVPSSGGTPDTTLCHVQLRQHLRAGPHRVAASG
jgi:hypothetical protein